MKHIYWFAYFDHRSPSVRYRAVYPLEWMLRTQGTSYHLVVPGYSPRRLLAFLLAYFSALLFRRKDSLIVIQRVRSGFIYANALRLLVMLRPSRTIYDLDDADYLEHPPGTIYFFAAKCENVFAGSRAIQEHLDRFNPRIALVTSPVVDLGIVKQRRSSVYTVGWVGDYAGDHRRGLEDWLFPALDGMDGAVRLVLLGVRCEKDAAVIMDRLRTSPNIEVDIPQIRSWSDERWIQYRIAAFDIGIATLMDTPLHRAKSGIKAKQYLNNGVPVLSPKLRENDRFVRHGTNGFLFSSVDELREQLKRVREMDEDEYAFLSTQARLSVKEFDHAHYWNAMLAGVA